METSTIQYEFLNPAQAADYAAMTFTKYRAHLEAEGNTHVRYVRLGAAINGEPAGLLIGQISHQTGESGLLSLYTAPAYRNQGIAGGLVAAYETWLRQQGSPAVVAEYSTLTKAAPMIEHLLAKQGWDAPERLTSVVYIPTTLAIYERFTQTPMGQLGCDLPPGYTYTGWLDISDEDKAALHERIAATVPYDENPFNQNDAPIDPSSIAILSEGEIAAWMINHRVAPDRLRFSILYLSSEHRGQKLGIKLVNESVRRAFLPFEEDTAHQELFVFQSRLENEVMQFYITAIGAVIARVEELRRMKKVL